MARGEGLFSLTGWSVVAQEKQIIAVFNGVDLAATILQFSLLPWAVTWALEHLGERARVARVAWGLSSGPLGLQASWRAGLYSSDHLGTN